MKRISDPLNKMNAKIYTTNGTMPITIKGSKLLSTKINLTLPQLKLNQAYY